MELLLFYTIDITIVSNALHADITEGRLNLNNAVLFIALFYFHFISKAYFE